MKKSLLTITAITAIITSTFALSSCSNENKKTINIQFVPSVDPGKLATLATSIEPLLEKYEPDYKFRITTGSSYAATTQAMLSKQIDIGFLTASGYAEVTLKNPGKVEVLMTSVRKGYQVQIDYTTETEQRAAMNGEIAGYEYLGQQSEKDVNWYSSQLVVRNEYYVDANKDGVINVKDMAGLTVARQGVTSGSGYLRPMKYLSEYGMTMVDEIKDPTKEIKGVNIGSNTAACEAMMNNSVAGFWGFTDVRYANFYTNMDSPLYMDKSIFKDYKVVAITDGIYNDTISARSDLDNDSKEAVKNAFKQLVKDGDINTEGSGAFLLYSLYSHTGYTDAKDSDFDGERAFYSFCVDNNLI